MNTYLVYNEESLLLTNVYTPPIPVAIIKAHTKTGAQAGLTLAIKFHKLPSRQYQVVDLSCALQVISPEVIHEQPV